MSTTFRYISNIDENNEIIDWFKSLTENPVINETETSIIILFSSLGEVTYLESGKIDVNNSPVINIFPTRTILGKLFTVGEVHFLTKKLNQKFPKLESIKRNFRKWLKSKPLVFSRKSDETQVWNYYLEGSIQNYDSDIYALKGGYELLENETYFVNEDITENQLQNLAKTLRLRGIKL